MTNAFVSSGLHSSTISLCHRRRQRVCQHGKTVTMSTNGTGRPQRVAIVGAGISGLMTALALVRKGGVPAEGIDIFEPRESVDDGQGASLNLNGGNILLSECYGIDLSSEASPIERIIARNAVGRTLYQLDVRNAAQRLGADKLISPSGQMLAVMAMRDKVQHILQDAVSDAGVRIHRGSKYAVSNVDLGGETRPFARLQLADGQLTDAYDLVVGADGVRSHVRKAVAGDGKRLTARYTGFRVLWGVGNTVNEASIPHGELHQWFGNGCYALHVSAGPRDAKRDIVAINFRDPRPRDENEGYRQGGDAICERAEQLLFDAGLPHSLRDVFHSSQRFIETPVYSHVTTGWSKKGACVLVGDSGKWKLYDSVPLLKITN